MIQIHREGRLIVGIAILLWLLVIVITSRIMSPIPQGILTLGMTIVLLLVLRFFRVPRRRPFIDPTSVIAPADGKIVAIERVIPSEFITEECIQVSIFMNIHDVHVNYYPAEGRIAYVKYHPGKYLLARHPKSSELNEHSSVGIDTGYGPVLVRQIAGYVARRVKCYAKEGRSARQGKEMGFIKFGSRLDLFLPAHSKILVNLGDKVSGSLTPIARLKAQS